MVEKKRDEIEKNRGRGPERGRGSGVRSGRGVGGSREALCRSTFRYKLRRTFHDEKKNEIEKNSEKSSGEGEKDRDRASDLGSADL